MIVTAIDNIPELKEKKRGQRIVNPIPKRLYTLREASIYLGRGLHGVRDMVWRGEIPVIKSKGKFFVDINDLNTWIAQNKVIYE